MARSIFIILTMLFLVRPAYADEPRAVYSLGVGSTFAGRPGLVSQQWGSPKFGMQYLFGVRYKDLTQTEAGVETSIDTFAFDVATYFRLNARRWGDTEVNAVVGFEATVASVGLADRITQSDAFLVAGVQVSHDVTSRLSLYAQTGIGFGVRSRASLIVDGVVSADVDDASGVEFFFGPSSFLASFGAMWWVF